MTRVRITTTAVEKPITITYSECEFVGVAIQHDKFIRLIISSSVGCLALSYFSTSFRKGTIFFKKREIIKIKYLFWFSLQLLSEAFLILRKSERGITENFTLA